MPVPGGVLFNHSLEGELIMLTNGGLSGSVLQGDRGKKFCDCTERTGCFMKERIRARGRGTGDLPAFCKYLPDFHH